MNPTTSLPRQVKIVEVGPRDGLQNEKETITPHISAATLRRESVAQIAAKMRRLHAGDSVAGIVNRLQGY